MPYCKSLSLSLCLCFPFFQCVVAAAQSGTAKAPAYAATSPLMDAMTTELDRAVTSLSKAAQPNQQPPYYIGYDTHDVSRLNIVAQQGAILLSDESHQRTADITVRVGDAKVDNTHGAHRTSAIHSIELPLTDNRSAIARMFWRGTNTCYGNAFQSYLKVKSELAVQATGAYNSSYQTRVLPDFLSVVDNPTLTAFSGKEFSGTYSVDDEGVPAQKVALVQDGKLVSYRLGREPIRDFPDSNGHGRAAAGRRRLP